MKFFKYLLLLVAVMSIGKITAMDRLKNFFGSSTEQPAQKSPASAPTYETPKVAVLKTSVGNFTGEDFYALVNEITEAYVHTIWKDAEPLVKAINDQGTSGPFKDMFDSYQKFDRQLKEFLITRRWLAQVAAIRYYIATLAQVNLDVMRDFITSLAQHGMVIDSENPIETIYEFTEKDDGRRWANLQTTLRVIETGERLRNNRFPARMESQYREQIPIANGFREALSRFERDDSKVIKVLVPIIKQANALNGIPVPE
jgi:hypothetical protein